MSKVIPVILCGGVGSRLWPESRSDFPKQFNPIIGDNSMLQETVKRLDGIDNLGTPIFITNEKYNFIISQQLSDVGVSGHIILEPCSKNTAPAIALASHFAISQYGDDVTLLILSSDHLIFDVDSFYKDVNNAVEFASENNNIVTFGVKPTSPETGFGYIKAVRKPIDLSVDICDIKGEVFIDVTKFVEKPSLTVATSYIESGEYFWNSGMFVTTATTYISELKKTDPEMVSLTNESLVGVELEDGMFISPNREPFEKCNNISIDYAVMEKSDIVKLLPISFDWSDVGSWGDVFDVFDKVDGNNVADDKSILLDCENVMVRSAGSKVTAVIGMSNVIIVDTADALLVVDMTQTQSVSKVVDFLVENNMSESANHNVTQRPWGWFECLSITDQFKIKKITIKPGERISTQKHLHRSEHWVIIKGSADVENGDVSKSLFENESIYIPVGSVHTLSNPGKIDLEIIEVQTGSYIEEDDIVRFNDKYGRE